MQLLAIHPLVTPVLSYIHLCTTIESSLKVNKGFKDEFCTLIHSHIALNSATGLRYHVTNCY